MNSGGGDRRPGFSRSSGDTDWQRALFIPLTILAWLAVAVIGAWVLTHLIKTVLTLVLAAIVAFALTPLVTLLSRYIPRNLAIAVSYLLGFTVIIGMVGLLIATAAAQVTNLVENLPHYSEEIRRHEPQIVRFLGPFGMTSPKFHQAEQQATAYISSVGTSVARDSVGIISGILGTLVDVILVLILSVYLTANGPNIANRLRQETPGSQRRHTTLLIAIVNQVVGGYIRGTLALAALIGSLVGVGMFFLGVPYPVLLGILAFFMEFIPVIGVLISGAVCVTVALFDPPIIRAVLVLGYFVIVHVLEGDVVGPRIMGRAVGIHPATALLALVAGTEVFGFWGALFGAPLAGLLQAIGTAALAEIRGGDPRSVLHAVKEQAEEQATTETARAREQAEKIHGRPPPVPPAGDPRGDVEQPP